MTVTELPMTQTGFHHAAPIYEDLPGWTEDISGARSIEDALNGDGVHRRLGDT